ncbi:MAG: ABC transporter substrate-binding protein [Janthinobacterium lividum]
METASTSNDRRASHSAIVGGLFAVGLTLVTSLPGNAAAQPTITGLTSAGKITFCSALTQPPFESLTADGTAEGIDVDLGTDLSKRLGLGVAWNNIPFSGLIPALQAGQCDAILSDLFVKEERMQVLDFVPYMYSQEVLMVKAGTPGIETLADLSTKKAATVTGTTATQLLEAASTTLTAAGKPAINIVMFPENTQALQQLQFGQVDAFGVAYEIAEYYMARTPGTFKLGGPTYFKILTGIGFRKDSAKLRDAMQQAFDATRSDGSYDKLIAKYHLESDALTTK